MRFHKRYWIALLIAGVAVCFCLRPQRALPARGGLIMEARQPYVGVASCSARSCHGADNPAPEGRLLRNEYTRWIESDPHAQAYSVLFGERSQLIMKNLAAPGKAAGAAHEDLRCLACHCEPNIVSQRNLGGLRVDGVSCESCHGPAREWLEPHTAPASWARYSTARKKTLGMADVKDAASLARTCAGCHVGAPASSDEGTRLRDVNHDLLAAGHPRLNFEFVTFLANLPPHWKQTADGPDSERREGAGAWRAGQVAAARASLALLGDRVQRATAHNQTGVWPEFAEYDCASCHHALTVPSARQRPPGKAGFPGRVAWGNWYFAMPQQLLSTGPEDAATFMALRRHLEQPYPSLPETGKLVEAATHALDRIAGANKLPDKALAGDLLARLGRLGLPADRNSWEFAEQLSLSAVWLDKSRGRTIAPGKTASGQEVFGKLAFPQGHDEQSTFYWDDKFARDFKGLLEAGTQAP